MTKDNKLTDSEIKEQETSNIHKQTIFDPKWKNAEKIHASFWQHLKATSYLNKSKEHSSIVLNVENQNLHDALKIVNHFNSFTNVAASLARTLPKPFSKYCTNTSFKNYYRNKGIVPESFDLQTMAVHFTLSELEKLNIAKSTVQTIYQLDC